MDEDNFDKKLAAQKEQDKIKEREKEEKMRLENKKAPHLTNLNEDPQLSQKIYYALKECKYDFCC
jgi:hypothetical protein